MHREREIFISPLAAHPHTTSLLLQPDQGLEALGARHRCDRLVALLGCRNCEHPLATVDSYSRSPLVVGLGALLELDPDLRDLLGVDDDGVRLLRDLLPVAPGQILVGDDLTVGEIVHDNRPGSRVAVADRDLDLVDLGALGLLDRFSVAARRSDQHCRLDVGLDPHGQVATVGDLGLGTGRLGGRHRQKRQHEGRHCCDQSRLDELHGKTFRLQEEEVMHHT